MGEETEKIEVRKGDTAESLAEAFGNEHGKIIIL